MSNRRKFGLRLKKQSFIYVRGPSNGLLYLSLGVSSNTRRYAGLLGGNNGNETGRACCGTRLPASFPDYFDSHATDTNGDGKVDAKDTPKWPDPTGGAAGSWITPLHRRRQW